MVPLTQLKTPEPTEVGSYFVSNYPPFSVWSAGHVPAAYAVLDGESTAEGGCATSTAEDGCATARPLGLYVHIPFCRKRCTFCYFRVYTDKNASEVDQYCSALGREVALYAKRRGLAGRQFEFVYFGGGTPSFLSNEQLERLIDRVREHWTWEAAREVTFECEPGTLKLSKLETLRRIGVTRLSLGVEHFDDDVLGTNGRAHKSPEIFRAWEWIREVGFPQVNIDLIAGMVGETDDKWRRAVARAIELDADSVTIYQMELPFNTVISREAISSGAAPPVAGWETKRGWVDYAFREFEKAGYVISSGYTLAKPKRHAGFVYRDSLWHGADLVGMGVASFSHFGGVHYQNADRWEDYLAPLERGELPIARALPLTADQRLIREVILQLKTGRLSPAYFREKFSVSLGERFGEALGSLERDGLASVSGEEIRLSREGVLRVDGLLPRFFESEFRGIRYT